MNGVGNSAPSRRVVVIGGGISGLAAAHRLVESGANVELKLLEADDRLGGVLRTVRKDGFLYERSADNFITNLPWAIDLCRRVGLGDELLRTDERFRQAMVVHRGRLCKIPEGFLIMAPRRVWPMLTTPILSWRGKLRLAWEYFVPARRSSDDESLADFARRRLGTEVYERLVQPLVGGIYTADPRDLSVQATMSRFQEMEREHGGLIRAARRQRREEKRQASAGSGARYSLFVAPAEGMTALVEALAERLPREAICLRSPVRRIERTESDCWHVVLEGNQECLRADAVIVAVPSARSARLLAEVDPELAGFLGSIETNPCAVACLGYRRDQIGHAMDGFGFVVPAGERRRILSASFSSVKFRGRAPEGCELIRVFLGGAFQRELVDRTDQELLSLIREELADLMSVRGEPLFHDIVRWRGVMPQYRVGHRDLVAEIERRCDSLPALRIAGNIFDGVGIPQCIHRGEQVADQVLTMLFPERSSLERAELNP